jgi:hypothetical protein
MTPIDLGDLCVYCGADTSFGNGKFVNRIPADNTVEVVFDGPHSADLEVTGWLCDDCQPREWTCDGCLDLVPDGAGYYVNDMRVCEGCAEKVRLGGS